MDPDISGRIPGQAEARGSRRVPDGTVASDPRNVAHVLGWRRPASRFGAACLSALLLSAAFPPLETDWLVWFALVPLFWMPRPPNGLGRWAVGLSLGYVHYATNLHWLNEIGFGAGWLLAIPCAFFPAIWFVVACAAETALPTHGSPAAEDGRAAAAGWRRGRNELVQALLLPAVWVALEWVRSWIFTGFPWNQLGISQWGHCRALRITTVTGVYGLSYLIVLVNVSAAHWSQAWWGHFHHGRPRRTPWSVGAAIVVGFIMLYGVHSVPELGDPDRYFRVAAVQGNIPQCREWTQEQLEESLSVYDQATRQIVAAAGPELVVWPETAIPAAVRFNQDYVDMLTELVPAIRTPLLLGSVDRRPLPGQVAGEEQHFLDFNTAMLFDETGTYTDYYDKVHLVPFGEFVPFGEMLPWLVDWIGMGRGLTPGSEFTVFRFGEHVRAGANICFEDAFPGISREFVLSGANVLMTLTNDAWYAESSGSRQHLLHAVFRAAESSRPLLRSGNNSDTCLILPDGRIVNLLYDPVSGNRFVRGARVYQVPVWDEPGYTWYTLHGDVFAHACSVVAAASVASLVVAWFRRRHALLERVQGTV